MWAIGVLVLLLMVAAVVAAYCVAIARVLSKIIRHQQRQLRRESRRADALLDRLVMRHGSTPLGQPVVEKAGPLLTMPMRDPFEAAQEEWEAEDEARVSQMYPLLDEDEKLEISAEARRRSNGN